MTTLLFLGLGAIALALDCLGIYSVMSYLAAERRHKMGIRLALGARDAALPSAVRLSRLEPVKTLRVD